MNKMNKIKLRQVVKEEIRLLSEGSVVQKFNVELVNLIQNIKIGKGVDTRAIKTMTDGELLAGFLTGIFQSALLKLDDRKGFVRNFRI